MAYGFTFTPRFQKHFKGLTTQEKKQLKKNLSFWPRTLLIHHCVLSVFKEPLTFLSAVST